MIGPTCLADAIDHGSELPVRIRKSLRLMRQLDLASRLVTTAADKILEERAGESTDAKGSAPAAASSKQRGGGKGGKREGKAAGKKGSGKRKAAESDEDEDDEDEEEGKGRPPDLKALQRAALRCADEKVSLAVHVYDLLDTQIRRVDLDLRRLERHYALVPPPLDASRSGGSTVAGGDVASVAPMMVAAPVGGVGPVGRGRKLGPWGAGKGLTVATGRGKLPPVDPNEPVYCFCRQVAFGEMVACENENCEYEWFHFPCVGLTRQPPGNWLCAMCKRRKSGSLGGAGGHKRPKLKS